MEAYCRNNGLFYTPDAEEPIFTDVVEIDLSKIEANLSGPKRPQDLIPLSVMQETFKNILSARPETKDSERMLLKRTKKFLLNLTAAKKRL